MKLPRYRHDSDNKFLGRVEDCDLYLYHPFKGEDGVLIRRGNEPWNYSSVWISTLEYQLEVDNESFKEPEYRKAMEHWKECTNAKKKEFKYEFWDPFSDDTETVTFSAYTKGGAKAQAYKKRENMRKAGVFLNYTLLDE